LLVLLPSLVGEAPFEFELRLLVFEVAPLTSESVLDLCNAGVELPLTTTLPEGV
jgi:hypothetical protein